MMQSAFQRSNDRAESGSTAVEFAMVLPLLILFIFGMIDAGRMMWTWNQAEKATQMGARMAVVTDMVPSGLYDEDFSAALGQGQVVPIGSFDSTTCDDESCTGDWGYNPDAFDRIVARMQVFLPALTDANVRVDYENSGLGYSGDPNGADVAPLVTVRIVDLSFKPITGALFGVDLDMPEFRTGLTMEDGAGSASN